VCSVFLCYVYGLICPELMVLFMVFSLWIGVGFVFFSSQFPVIAHGLDLFSVAYLNSFTVSIVPSVRTAQSKGPASLDAFSGED